MSGAPNLSVIGYGMWTAAGHDGPSSVAAMRAGVSGASRANLWDYTSGENLMAFRVNAHQWWEGPTFLPELILPVVQECRDQVPEILGVAPEDIPILLGVAPDGRPGRDANLEHSLREGLAEKMGGALPARSELIAQGRVSLPYLLQRAASLGGPAIIVGVESFLRQSIVEHYIKKSRLLCGANSSGFIAGEAAAGLLVAPSGQSGGPELRITGMGKGLEPSGDGGSKDQPVSAKGLTEALRAAEQMSGRQFYDIPLVMADLNGEHFKFKELALASIRVDRLPPEGGSRRPRDHVEHWNVVETIGEVGAALLPAAMGWAFEAGRSGFLPGAVMFAAGEDDGTRVALVGEMA
ncbi:3-oxoacyl-ACP synthase [Yoonia sp. F2084L]|uniref:3-oxoacyl-ACP synthase n=1 Tax=Yoonia sp. F2084L TaxID=2926419 RepID=UPI001FF22B6B|nr:3-oxoacyl-ACP synthase [Yoonia sp. F2084L]MCK0097112.1 3-oxoacyl-ACP synthase [Yoonia sp. F2084L]